MTIGGLGASGYRPMRAITSAKFRPAALTSTTTWSSLATGSGRSSTRSTDGSPCSVVMTARIRTMLGEQVGRCLLGAPPPERRRQQHARHEHREHARKEPADADPHRRADAPQRRRDVLRARVVHERLVEEAEEQQPTDERRD